MSRRTADYIRVVDSIEGHQGKETYVVERPELG